MCRYHSQSLKSVLVTGFGAQCSEMKKIPYISIPSLFYSGDWELSAAHVAPRGVSQSDGGSKRVTHNN